MDKQRYRFVFVVLTYKNLDVLEDFFSSFCIKDSKIIVVESFYDDSTTNRCKEIALKYNAVFIPIPNKGYGYGNNIGIQYAIDNFDFKYLVISNSDIIINDFSYLYDFGFDDKKCIIAPFIQIKSTGKIQNPNIVYKSPFYLFFSKLGYRLNNLFIVRIGAIQSRLSREIVHWFMKMFKVEKQKIFSPHGSFMILTKDAVQSLCPLFNDEMFLYNEELHVAYKCKQHAVPVYYIPSIKITHLEGASAGDHLKQFKTSRDSFNTLMLSLRQGELNKNK